MSKNYWNFWTSTLHSRLIIVWLKSHSEKNSIECQHLLLHLVRITITLLPKNSMPTLVLDITILLATRRLIVQLGISRTSGTRILWSEEDRSRAQLRGLICSSHLWLQLWTRASISQIERRHLVWLIDFHLLDLWSLWSLWRIHSSILQIKDLGLHHIIILSSKPWKRSTIWRRRHRCRNSFRTQTNENGRTKLTECLFFLLISQARLLTPISESTPSILLSINAQSQVLTAQLWLANNSVSPRA